MKQPVPNKESVVPQVTTREPTMAGNRFSIKLFIIAFVVTGAVLAWLTWSTYDLYTRDTTMREQVWRAGELRNTIIHLDEVLTMSARMTAATGDAQWEERYRIFEPQLDEAIKEIMKLGPSQMVAETDAANIKLVEMENRAFTLVREGHAEKARAILSSEEYETQKRIYADGMRKFFAQLEGQLNTTHRSERKKAIFSALAGIVVLAILLFSGLAIVRWLYKAHALLLNNITKRKQAEDVLRKAHHELEVRVQERTADLTTANSTLVKQIAERGQVEASLRESEERYRELFENAEDAIYVHDIHGNYLSVNAAAEKLAGYSRDELIGRNFAEFMAPQYVERIRTNSGKRLGGKGLTYEIEVLAKDGRSVPVEVSTRPIYEKGIVIGVQGIARDITERKRTEQALRESEERFRFLDSLAEAKRALNDPEQIMAVMSRMLGEYLRASRCAYADVEKDDEQFTILHDYTDGCASTVGNYQLSLFGARAVATLRSGQTLVIRNVEAELLPGEGADMFNAIGIKAIITCPLVKEGSLRAMMAVHQTTPRDWTPEEVAIVQEVVERCWATIARRAAEENLRQSEALLRIAGHTARLGGWAVDLPEVRITWSDEMSAILEVPFGTVPGLEQAFSFYAPQPRETISKAFEACAQQGTPFDLELEVITAKGRRVWTRSIGEAQRNAAGAITRVQGAFQDITERKQAEAERARLLSELESERTRLVDIFTHAPAFIASLRGPEHIFELANAHYYDLVGQRDLIGRRVRDAFPEVEGQGFFELLDNVYATGVPFAGDEMPVELARRAGAPLELRYINLVYQPLTDVKGTVSGIICHGVDVTEQVLSRRRLEETENQLRQSQKLESVGMLAGGIAHDFNNLLTVITGYSELTLKRLDEADPLARNVAEIKKAAERAASLTRQLLAFSRKQVLQPKVLDLNSVIVNLEKMLGRLVGEDMELRASPGVGLGQIKADPGQIEQVILNLVVNARDAMPKGGKITLETANIYLDEAYARLHIAVQPGWYAMLAVTDTGHGMDAETQKYIFEPFFTTKEQGQGTGLGLSTVYGIVKQSGGNIWVYSEVGVGTTFKIYLPLVDKQVTEPDADAARPDGAAGTETILLSEDEEMVRNLARDSLKMHGYTVLEAANAGEALLICQQHEGPIHLLLTDVVMPRMSGKELAEQLVRLRPDTRVLYMSGYTDQAIVHHGILDADIAFIEKPFTPDALVLKVVEVLQQNPSSIQSLERTNSPRPDGSKEKSISYQVNELDEIVSVSKV